MTRRAPRRVIAARRGAEVVEQTEHQTDTTNTECNESEHVHSLRIHGSLKGLVKNQNMHEHAYAP